jgi:hypothetical protein
MNGIHPSSRRSTAALVLLCIASLFMQSIVAPIHAASHAADRAAVSAPCDVPPTSGGHNHDPAQADAGDCPLCHLLSQTATDPAVLPPDLASLLQILTYLRGPTPRPLPTRLVINDSGPRAPPAHV